MVRTARRLSGRPLKLFFDLLVGAGFVAVFVTREGPDLDAHSVVGLALVLVVAAHIWGNLGWVNRVIKRGRKDRDRWLGLLNLALVAVVATCTVTGIPAWADVGGFEIPHAVTGFLAIFLVVVHLALNSRRFGRLLRRRSNTRPSPDAA